jgi:hypothetical protein
MRSALFALLVTLAATPSAAQQKELFDDFDYKRVCEAPALADDGILINANSGSVKSGKTQFHEGTTVQVVYHKPNPFRYNYAFSRAFMSFDATQTFDFFKVVPGMEGVLSSVSGLGVGASVQKASSCTPLKKILEATVVKTDGQTLTSKEPLKGVTVGQQVKFQGVDMAIAVAKVDGETQLTLTAAIPAAVTSGTLFEVQQSAAAEEALSRKVEAQATSLRKELAALVATATPDNNRLSDPLKSYTALELVLFKSQALECSAVMPRVNQLLGGLHDVLNLSLDKHVAAANALLARGEALKSDVDKHAYVNEACSVELKQATDSLDKDLRKAAADQKTLQDGLNEMQGAYDALRERFTASDLFYFQDRVTQPRPGNETLQIAVTKVKSNDSPDPPKPANVRLQFGEGESRIRVSAGIGFSTGPDARVARVPGKVTTKDEAGKDVTTDVTRFGYESKSGFRPSAMVMVSVLPWDITRKGIRRATFGPSVGLVLTNRGTGTVTEYLGGMSVGLAGDLAFVTVGFHAAQPEDFPTGYKEGDVIPSNLPDPLPVRRDWKRAAMVSLTFKLR